MSQTFSKCCDPGFLIFMFIKDSFEGLEAGLKYKVQFCIQSKHF